MWIIAFKIKTFYLSEGNWEPSAECSVPRLQWYNKDKQELHDL